MNFLLDTNLLDIQFNSMLILKRTKNDLYANTNILFYDTNKHGIKKYWVRDAFCYAL